MKLKQPPATLGAAPARLQFADTDERSLERKRRALSPFRKWYSLRRWKVLRIAIFKRDGFTCQMCKRLEGNTSRLVCDHIQPHRGDERLFWDENNLQTLCKTCHDSDKQSIERQSGD